jgi:hypothetical protein
MIRDQNLQTLIPAYYNRKTTSQPKEYNRKNSSQDRSSQPYTSTQSQTVPRPRNPERQTRAVPITHYFPGRPPGGPIPTKSNTLHSPPLK